MLPGPTARVAPRVLWIDDELLPDAASVRLLGLEGFRVDCAASGAAGLARIQSDSSYAAVLLDLRLPDMYGLSVLERVTARLPALPIVVITGCYGEPETERLARKCGASAFCRKPVTTDEITAVLATVLSGKPARPPERRRSESEALVALRVSPSLEQTVAWVREIASTRLPVLITGETGTGKGLLARAVHECSPRSRGAFVTLNCAGLPEGLVESELFGHCRGAFTGAWSDKAGLVEEAHGGTLFLDEIGEMSLQAQLRLLRFLDDGECRRVGATRPRLVDVRVVAATNRQLVNEVARGAFRRDLFFRLAVASRHLPPLRERTDDLEALSRHLLAQVSSRIDGRAPLLSADAIDLLRRHSWPGNVRELRNVLEYAACFAPTGTIEAIDLTSLVTAPCAIESSSSARSAEEAQTLEALQQNRWNRERTARQLGISRSTLWRRMIASRALQPQQD